MSREQQSAEIEGGASRKLSRFSVPEEYRFTCFKGQFEKEEALFAMRRHWVIHAENVFITLVSLSVLTILVLLFRQVVMPTMRLSAVFLLIVMGTLYILLFVFVRWVDHHLSMIILTDRRLVWIKQRHLFSRTMVETLLEQIQDVRAETHGFFPTILHYGEVNVETAKATIKFTRVPHSASFVGYIMELVEKNKAATKPEQVIDLSAPPKMEHT